MQFSVWGNTFLMITSKLVKTVKWDALAEKGLIIQEDKIVLKFAIVTLENLNMLQIEQSWLLLSTLVVTFVISNFDVPIWTENHTDNLNFKWHVTTKRNLHYGFSLHNLRLPCPTRTVKTNPRHVTNLDSIKLQSSIVKVTANPLHFDYFPWNHTYTHSHFEKVNLPSLESTCTEFSKLGRRRAERDREFISISNDLTWTGSALKFACYSKVQPVRYIRAEAGEVMVKR